MNTIGREKKQDIYLDGYNITRRHARIQVDTEKKICVFEDLGSLNGSYLNNAKINKRLLKENDVIEIGTNQLLFLAN
jgi:adenylate cyclase